MGKVGRPTKLTPEVRKKMEEAAAMDCSIEEICLYAGITKPTYYDWTKADLEFSARLEALRADPVLKARTTIIEAITKNPQTAAWYLERKRKKEFAERKELTGQDGDKLFDDQTREKSLAAIRQVTSGGDTTSGQ